MENRKFIFLVLAILSILLIGCSKQVYIDENNESLKEYAFNISNQNKIDNTLCRQKYIYSTAENSKYVSIVTYVSNKATMTQYLVKDGDTLNVSVQDKNAIIISLPANSMIKYNWQVTNDTKFEKTSFFEIPSPKFESVKDGVNYDRQNFYFNPLKNDNEVIVLTYQGIVTKTKGFEVTINVNKSNNK